MAKRKIYQSHKSKDRQYNGQKKKIPKAINQRTDNTIAKRKRYQSYKSKDRQNSGQKKKIPKP